MEIQAHFIGIIDEVNKQIDDMVANDEVNKTLDRPKVEEMFFDKWLESFEIRNPDGNFFNDAENDDEMLVCNIQSKLELLLSTLEIFGLHKDYINGGGHHADWETKKALAASKKKKKGAGKGKKQSAAMEKLAKNLAQKRDDLNKKPTYFDLEPFKKALKSFLHFNAEVRSNLRCNLYTNKEELVNCFMDVHDEKSFKRCIDLNEVSGRF